MRAVVQTAAECSVTVGNDVVGIIKKGLLVYLGVSKEDSEKDVDYVAKKIINLRIFEDQEGKINLSLNDVTDEEILVVSQFTLYGDVRKGRRPSFSAAAGNDKGEKLYNLFLARLAEKGYNPQHGMFGELMHVKYTNIGPMTILIDSMKNF